MPQNLYVYENSKGSSLPLVVGCKQWIYSCIATNIEEADEKMEAATGIDPEKASWVKCHIKPFHDEERH